MSTFYFLCCDSCREFCDGASQSGSGASHLCASVETLPPFIVHHATCPGLKVRVEGDPVLDKYDDIGGNLKQGRYIEWTRDNLDDLFDRDRPNG